MDRMSLIWACSVMVLVNLLRADGNKIVPSTKPMICQTNRGLYILLQHLYDCPQTSTGQAIRVLFVIRNLKPCSPASKSDSSRVQAVSVQTWYTSEPTCQSMAKTHTISTSNSRNHSSSHAVQGPDSPSPHEAPGIDRGS